MPRWILSAMGLCILSACTREVHESLDLGTVEIRLERTMCFGWCPDYLVVIEGNGRVEYTGGAFVKETGNREGRIPEPVVRGLVDGFQRIGFLDLADESPELGNDLPATTLTLRVGDRRKRVGSCLLGFHVEADGKGSPNERAYEALGEMADSIDRAVGIEKWIGTREERARLFAEGTAR